MKRVKEIIEIDMFKVYVGKLIFRCTVFGVALLAYLFKFGEIWIFRIVWGIMMISMILQMIPQNKRITMGSKKGFASHYVQSKDYSELEMYHYVQKNDLAAIRVLLLWLSFNAIFGILYLLKIIGVRELILLSVFYYMCDLICVVIWCPFQSFIIKNRCCVNCRIFNWGYFMMFTPMLFIRNFFSWSLLFTSILLMLRWEITLIKHPEQFWEGSNDALKCENCKDVMCKFKKPKNFEA